MIAINKSRAVVGQYGSVGEQFDLGQGIELFPEPAERKVRWEF
jgi:hypothetical protein